MFNICRIAMTDQFHLKIELQVAIIGFKAFCNKEKEAAQMPKIKATSKNNQVSDITKVSKINSASLIVYIGMRSTIITQPASF